MLIERNRQTASDLQAQREACASAEEKLATALLLNQQVLGDHSIPYIPISPPSTPSNCASLAYLGALKEGYIIFFFQYFFFNVTSLSQHHYYQCILERFTCLRQLEMKVRSAGEALKEAEASKQALQQDFDSLNEECSQLKTKGAFPLLVVACGSFVAVGNSF